MAIMSLAGLPPQYHERVNKPLAEHGLVLARTASGRPMVNVSRVVVDMDASGFDFGSRRSRDRELAINACHAALKTAGYRGPTCRRRGVAFFAAYKFAQQFGERFIFSAKPSGEVVPWEDIRGWLASTGLIKSDDKGAA